MSDGDTTARTAIVTGGASGIGLATGALLHEQGWNVVLADRNPTALDTALREAGHSDRVLAVQTDVTDPEDAARTVARAETAFGGVDALVNCAGTADNAPFLETTPESFRRILDINLVGTFLMGQAAARGMRRRGGSIVNIASVSGLRGSPDRAAYSASKGGVVTLTKVMAVELGACGIRVNCVAPGSTNTPLVRAAQTARERTAILRAIPLERYAEPPEIAEVIAFLAGHGASYVTGQIWGVDGGQLAGAGWQLTPE